DCVRVEASKKRLIWVRPRKTAFFFSIWRETATAASAGSRRPTISSALSPSMPNRCRWGKLIVGEEAARFIKATPIGGVATKVQDPMIVYAQRIAVASRGVQFL